MRRPGLVTVFGLVILGCGGRSAPPAVDSAATAQRVADSTLTAHTRVAAALDSEARSVMVQLLRHPETASFDSMTVTQPAMSNGSWPAPAVCGRIGGKPGVNGARGMTPFIYSNRLTVFVLDATNGPQFAALRAKMCDGPAVRVLRR